MKSLYLRGYGRRRGHHVSRTDQPSRTTRVRAFVRVDDRRGQRGVRGRVRGRRTRDPRQRFALEHAQYHSTKQLPPQVRLDSRQSKAAVDEPRGRSNLRGCGICRLSWRRRHARRNTRPHVHERWLYEVIINGQPCSEARINAAVAGTFGVPVVFLSGDQSACADARSVSCPGLRRWKSNAPSGDMRRSHSLPKKLAPRSGRHRTRAVRMQGAWGAALAFRESGGP